MKRLTIKVLYNLYIYNRSFDIPLMLACKYLFKGTAYLVIPRPPPYITELQDRFTMVLVTPLSDQKLER